MFLSYSLIPNFSATNFPIYLPPEPYSLAIVITIPLSVTAVSGISFLSAFAVSTPSAFMLFVSFTRSITANTNANPSATGPALSTPIIP